MVQSRHLQFSQQPLQINTVLPSTVHQGAKTACGSKQRILIKPTLERAGTDSALWVTDTARHMTNDSPRRARLSVVSSSSSSQPFDPISCISAPLPLGVGLKGLPPPTLFSQTFTPLHSNIALGASSPVAASSDSPRSSLFRASVPQSRGSISSSTSQISSSEKTARLSQTTGSSRSSQSSLSSFDITVLNRRNIKPVVQAVKPLRTPKLSKFDLISGAAKDTVVDEEDGWATVAKPKRQAKKKGEGLVVLKKPLYGRQLSRASCEPRYYTDSEDEAGGCGAAGANEYYMMKQARHETKGDKMGHNFKYKKQVAEATEKRNLQSAMARGLIDTDNNWIG